MCSRSSCCRHAINECVDPRKGLVVFVLEGRIVIQYRHSGRRGRTLNVFLQVIRIFKNGRNKEECLLAESWVIVANCYFCEQFVARPTSTTPSRSKTISSEFSEENGIQTHLRIA